MLLLITAFSTLTVGGVFLLKFLVGRNRHTRPLSYECPVKMDGKTVLITGANSGIGKETAKGLVSLGAKVIMACRNLEKAEAAAEEIRRQTGVDPNQVVIIQLDTSDLESVRNCSRKVYATESKLDVLINNAGVGIGHVKLSKQGYEYTFAANHVGHFLLTHLLLGLLKKSRPSRIINVSSVRHQGVSKTLSYSRAPKPGSDMYYPGLFGYDTSKLAQIFHTNILAKQLEGQGVVANSMHPGYVSSGIWYKDAYKKSVIKFMRLFGSLSSIIGRTSKDAAQTLIYMATDPELENVSGQYFENVAISDQLSPFAKDPEMAKNMWDVSMEMCGLTKKIE